MKAHSKDLVLPKPYSVATDGNKNERSTGLHLSKLIYSIAVKMRLLTKDDEDETSQASDLCMHLGIAWENYVSQLLPIKPGSELMFHPGEIFLSDIAMSPDAIELCQDGTIIVHEFKCTWKSSRQMIEKHWMWLSQLKGYCKALGTTYAKLHVFHVRGDYALHWRQAITWDIEFNEQELEDNWDAILREARGFNARPISVINTGV